MRALYLAIVLLVAAALPALCNDQEKAEKQMRMMTALSHDEIVRSIISRTFIDVFKVSRAQLLAERRSLGLNYGSLFLAHELALTGSGMQQISAELRANKTAIEVANSSGADWKRIAFDAKKMNDRINNGIYKHFLHDQADKQRDLADQYTASADLIRADTDSTPDEILKAAADYRFWRNLAAPKNVGQVDTTSAAVENYSKARDAIAATHGTTNPSTPIQ
jgi:hypothetical protein